MNTLDVKYNGNLRNEATHTKSGTILVTDAPIDNEGKGESFSPTDLFCASLATCMLTIMGIVARKKEIPFDDVTASIVKVMNSNPRRIGEVVITINIQNQLIEKERKILEKSAKTCPVALSIAKDVKVSLTFEYN